MSQLRLSGIIPATVTPMNERYEVVEDDLRSYMRWITRYRIGGLAVNVDTGEGPTLTREERKRILSIVSSVVKGRVPIIAGVPPASTHDATRTATDARDAGAEGLLVFPNPAFLGKPLPAEPPYEYHRAIAEGSGLSIILFQLQPDLGGYDLSEEVLLKLIQIPEVVAIKEASFDAKKYNALVRILERAPRKITLLTGNDNFIAESLIIGGEGALIGFGTLATQEQVEIHERIKKGQYSDALEIWNRILPLEEVIFGLPVRDYRARTKIALALQGVIENVHVRPPLLPLSREEIDKVRGALKSAEIPTERSVEAVYRKRKS